MAGFENIVSNIGNMATGIVQQVGVEAVTGTFVSIRNLGERYEQLKQELQLLLAIRDDKEREVQRNRHKDTSSSYRLWTTKVLETAEKVNGLINEYERESESSNWLWRRSNLSSEMEKRLTEVHQLIENGNFADFLVDKPPDRILKVFDAPQIMGYQTLQSALENVIDLLRSSKIKTIGVHGIKGVGKTAVMQNLNNHNVVAELFDIVIFVTLSADHTDHELQCKIAKRLKLDIEVTNDPKEVAGRIHEELQGKKLLLILDEVVKEINLIQLGILCDDNRNKVVMTAQNSQVCIRNGVDRLIKVGSLSRNEAWKMFRNIVGPVIDLPDIPAIARRVCDKCSCLPLLIHKIARSFRLKKSACSWRVGLDDLEEHWPDYENEGEDELYSVLMFCYNELKDENKKCFLYASLYPANCKVHSDYLVECWAAQDFLGDVDDTRKYQKVRDHGHAILEHLTDVSLLDKGKQMIYVTMNDCMKRLALHISSKYPEYSSYIQTREKLEEGQEPMSWKNARWVSMIDNNLQDLPTNQDCSTLLTLLLQKNPELSKIPLLFFKKHMRGLLVLDLYGTGIRQLPSSISKLTGLKGLYLNDCKHLTKLPRAIRSLKLLEFLDVRGTKLNFMSSHIGYLSKLRCLRIPYIKSSGDPSEDQEAEIDPCAISRLTKLEELVIEVVSYQDWCSDSENVMAMLASLEHLTNLQCCFPSSNSLERLLTRRSGRQFTSFQFFVGCQNSRRPQILESFEYRISKYMRYDNSKHENTFSISEILPHTHAFELINFKDITELSHLGKEKMEHIRGLSLEECNEIHTLIAGNENGVRDASTLPNLEQLHLRNLQKLNCVFRGPLHHGSLSKLKVLTLKNCKSLKSIFGNGSIQYLLELQILEIQSCPEFEELVLVTEIGENYVLPKLEVLMLVNLPRFMCVSKNDTLTWSSLEQVNVYNCPALKSLPFCKDNATNLRSIRGEQGWWNELQWTNKDHFQDIFLPSCEYVF